MVDPVTNCISTPLPKTPSEAPTPPGQIDGLATQKERNAEAAAAQPPVVVSAIVNSHFELVQVAPRLQGLEGALSDRPVGGIGSPEAAAEQGDYVETHIGKTWEELLEVVQASPVELEAALEEKGAMCLAGKWRGVDSEYLGTLVELILLTAVEKGWSLSAVPAKEAGEALAPHGFSVELTEHCLQRFSKPILSSSSNGSITDGVEKMDFSLNEGVYALHAEAVCRHFGLKLLREKRHWDSLSEFLAVWSGAVPEEMSSAPKIELLRGQALLEADDGEGVDFLPIENLPRNAENRFSELFGVRPRWELKDLEPYIEGLAGPGETMEMLLLRFARMSQQRPTDPITYSARFN